MAKIRNFLKNIWLIKVLIVSYRAVRSKTSLLTRISLVRSYFNDLKKYKQLEKGNFILEPDNLKPCIYDRTIDTPVDPVYFYQDSWCAGKIFKNKPKHHHDIASNANLVGIVSQFTPTTMIDIRPINLEMPGLFFKKASIISLPFESNSIESLSSICVIEHIGLGRYGDELDTFGTEKAVKELVRVLKPNGNLYVSIPVDIKNRIYFNAHRAFTRDYILRLFADLKLVDENYIYGRKLFNKYDISQGFGTGMYHFTK